MSDAGECVVFRIEIDQPSTRSTQCFKRSVETVGMACDGESLLLKKIANGIVRTILLVGELGVGPDLSSTSLVSHLQYETLRKPQHSVRKFTSWFTWRRDSSSVARAASTDVCTSIPTVERVMV
jgi:hypothetical protein